jgi:hypothetical protein
VECTSAPQHRAFAALAAATCDVPQVLTFTAVVAPNQDLAFMGAIAWTAINLLMSNFMVRYNDINQVWFSQLRYVWCSGWLQPTAQTPVRVFW